MTGTFLCAAILSLSAPENGAVVPLQTEAQKAFYAQPCAGECRNRRWGDPLLGRTFHSAPMSGSPWTGGVARWRTVSACLPMSPITLSCFIVSAAQIEREHSRSSFLPFWVCRKKKLIAIGLRLHFFRNRRFAVGCQPRRISGESVREDCRTPRPVSRGIVAGADRILPRVLRCDC